MNINIENYYTARKNIFERFDESSTITKIVFSFLMACITGLMAQIIIPLPWTPVPITAQTFAVLCSGLFLGKKYGCLSQIIYIVLGIAFVPWFGGMTGGLDVLLGSTGGYLIGFVIASYFIGYITEKYGLIGLALWAYLTQGAVLGVVDLLLMGLVPFIFGDLIKIAGTAGLSKVFLPKE